MSRSSLLLVFACVLGACTSYDPNAGIFPREAGVGGSGAVDPNANGDAGGGGGGGVDPFAGLAAYTQGAAPLFSLTPKHMEEVGMAITGKDCFSSNCHGGNGDGPSLVFGGTVYTDSSATAPAVGVEVRVVDASGNGISVYSDNDGNFYQLGYTQLAFPAHPGVRNGNGSVAMMNDLNSPSCNSSGCHDGTTQARVFAP